MNLGASAAVVTLATFDFEDGDGGSYLDARAVNDSVSVTQMGFQTDESFAPDSAGDTRTDVTFDDSDDGNWNSIIAKNPNSSNQEDFLTFTITPNAGVTLNYECLDLTVAKSNSNGVGFKLRSKRSQTIVQAGDRNISEVSTSDNKWEWMMFDLSTFSELQNITESVTFELVLNNAPGNVDVRFDKIRVSGAVPEPSTVLMLMLVGACFTLQRRSCFHTRRC